MTEFHIQVSPEASRLMAASDQEPRRRYPGEAVKGIDAGGFEVAGGVFAIGYIDDEGS